MVGVLALAGGSELGATSSEAARIEEAYPQTRGRFAERIVEVARSVGAHPFDLANLMRFESGLNPRARNALSGASGLIQFMPSTAAALGTNTERIRAMSAPAQMDLVERYLRPYAGRIATAAPLYMAVFYPAYMAVPPDTPFPARVQVANPGIRTPRDYVALANRGARLPSTTPAEQGALARVGTVPLLARRAALRAPWWLWPAGAGLGLAAFLGILGALRRRRMRARRAVLP